MLTPRAPNWGPSAFRPKFWATSGLEDLAGFGVDAEFGRCRRLGRGRGLAARLGVFEAEAVAVELKDVDVVGQPVEERAGEAFRAHHRRPFVKGKIGGDDGRAAFMALAEHVEQQLGAGA